PSRQHSTLNTPFPLLHLASKRPGTMASEHNNDHHKTELESELTPPLLIPKPTIQATSLASLKPYRLKRSWIDFTKQGSEIGVGGYGTVHRAKLQKQIFRPKIDIAVKKLYTTGDWDKRLSVSLALARELLVWSTLNHPNVLPLVGFHLSVKLDEAWLVSPLAPKGNIYDFLEHERPPLEKRLELVCMARRCKARAEPGSRRRRTRRRDWNIYTLELRRFATETSRR
ncbi:hypothetical protein FRB99_001658, partial [Tulasnella sp. 403]